MREIFKRVYRCLLSYKYRRKNIFLEQKVLFNRRTTFGGWNKVHLGTSISGSQIGRYTFIGQNCYLINAKIGKFCSIGNNVKVVAVTHPTEGFISTHPAFFSIKKQCGTTFVSKQLFDESMSIAQYSCIIGNDVWIGDDVRIIGGKQIGDGAIIALGAVVTKDVPPYAIVGGVPAKIIRYRYDQQKIDELIKMSWWDKDDEWIRQTLL